MRAKRLKETRLRAARTKKGLRLVDLAAKAGIHYATAQEIDAGDREGTITTRLKISAALGDKDFSLWPESRRELRNVKRLMKSLE